MTVKVAITIHGDPVAKGRPRATRTGRVYTPKNTRAWEHGAKQAAALEMRGREIIKTPVKVTVICCFAVTKSWPRWKKEAAVSGYLAHDQKPDIDNVSKAALDACNEIVFKDDAQIIDLRCVKIFGSAPFVRVEIEKIDRLSLGVKLEQLKQFLKSKVQRLAA